MWLHLNQPTKLISGIHYKNRKSKVPTEESMEEEKKKTPLIMATTLAQLQGSALAMLDQI